MSREIVGYRCLGCGMVVEPDKRRHVHPLSPLPHIATEPVYGPSFRERLGYKPETSLERLEQQGRCRPRVRLS